MRIAARESHKAQKVLQEQRKAAKPHSSLLTEAKRAWSLARQKSISKTERTKHINALMDIVRGKVTDIVFKHDASRIIQTLVKYGGQKERNEIAVELKGKYNAAGIKVIVSAFGSTDIPTTSGADPTKTANDFAKWVIQNNLDGIDVDYEDFDAMNTANGKAEEWLSTFTKALRSQLPKGKYILTHARKPSLIPDIIRPMIHSLLPSSCRSLVQQGILRKWRVCYG